MNRTDEGRELTFSWVMCALFFAPLLNAQDLVVNGSFEAFKKCPKGPTLKTFKLDGKVKSAQGTPDFYESCSPSFGVPRNWSGDQAAFDGSAYTGLVLTTDMPDECGSREYVQLPLVAPLENGRRYRLTFHVSPSENSGYVTDRVGAIFTDVDHSKKGLPPGLRQRADVDNPLDHLIQDTTGWTTISGIYNAKGNERFIVIGNFQPCNRSTRKVLDGDRLKSIKRKTAARMDPNKERGTWQEWMSRTAYVYLDAVTLVSDTTSPDIIVSLTAEQACPSSTVDPIGPELISDPGFDRNDHPTANSWRNASDGTPDLMNGITGLYLHSKVNRDNREYIRTPLADTLSPCMTYHVSFDVKRNASYAFAVDAIGIAVTDTFTTRRNRYRMDLPWAWRSPEGSLLTNTNEPMTLCGNFRPASCATQLILGNFNPDTATTIVQEGQDNDGPFAYYFVDNVHLFAVGRDPGCIDPCKGNRQNPVSVTDEEPTWPDCITLHFNSSSDQPLEPVELEALAEVLRANPTYRLRITGHTDSSGSSDRNDRLAQDRADRLALVLKRSGVPAAQLIVSSAGSRVPISGNASVAGRAMNRRVELLLER